MNKKTTKHGMNRRSFLAGSSRALMVPLVLQGLPLRAIEGAALGDLFNIETETDRVLVLVQLNGGNDGLNTLIPLSDYGTYQRLRSNIAIGEKSVLPMRDDMGFHPVMSGIKNLWSDQKMNVIQGVAYPNPNLSHFGSTDIWMSGATEATRTTTGWIGRYLNMEYPGYPQGYPNTTMPDPIAIQIGAVTGLALTGLEHQSMGMALQDPEAFYRMVSGSSGGGSELPQAARAADKIEHVHEVQSKALQFSVVIKAAADKANNKVTYPTTNRLADQLKIVSRLIAGGLKTRVYVVQLNGFDTHAAQTDASDTTIGSHANLLKQVSEAVFAFQQDIEALGIADRVITMTFSEFGRRPASNVSLGTDHGTAAPMFVFGTQVEPIVTGTNPDLHNLDKDNLRMQFDFRQVYSSVLQQWFGVSPETVSNILYGTYPTVQVIKQQTTSVQADANAMSFTLRAVTPNPVHQSANITYELRAAMHVRLDVFDAIGFHVTTLADGAHNPGVFTAPFNTSALPSGTYVIQLTSGREQATQTIVVVR